MTSQYTICYFSKAKEDLPIHHVKEICEKATELNNKIGISGFIFNSLDNFFQVLEGEKEKVLDLYENHIKNDPRHHKIFEIVHRDSQTPLFAQYSSRFQTLQNSEQLNSLKSYLKKHSVDVKTSDKISNMLKSFVILDY
ncbi:BLUF domain-containing protein [Dokdonia sp. Hel_I_53]|uniref:BLUF domain-containing protein n=1 Tax=Dokdonia sp. Hel_I_53 TaxID=1566287 RepID=UPI00119BDE06|nr:BLUF domain-containing protein [Dokdonia sp. Hel_I_53]TVZ51528.1 FAD-dependent sensor of blue light [Dokdonia sp. Hel_I_53]